MTDIEARTGEPSRLSDEIGQDEMLRTAKELSDYIHALPLATEANDHLIELLLAHVTAATQAGYLRGMTVAALAAAPSDGIPC